MSEQESKTKKKHKKILSRKIKLAARIIISIALLVFFASQVDLTETFELIANTNYIYLLICLLLYLAGQAISAYKWNIISEAIGFKNKYIDYVQYYFIGMFFNLFLPSTIGGDVGKAYYLSKGDTDGRIAPAIYTVLAERFSGLTVLVWLGTLAMLTSAGQNLPVIIKYGAIALTLAIIIGAPVLPLFMKTFFSSKSWLNRSLMRDVSVFWNYKLVARCLGWSLIFHIIIILIHILISLAMNLSVDPFYYFAIYPIIAIIGFIPIAFNGIGVREGAYIYFLALVNVPQSAGLAFGLLWFAIVVCASLIGGVVYIKGQHSPPPKEYEPPELTLEDMTQADYNDSIDENIIVVEEKNTVISK